MLFACGAYRCSALLHFRSWVNDTAGATTRRVCLVFEDSRNCRRVVLDAGWCLEDCGWTRRDAMPWERHYRRMDFPKERVLK